MSRTFASLSMSLDGFIAGPHASPSNPLGDGGDHLHEWMYAAQAWRERRGELGGEVNRDDHIVQAIHDRTGAYVMGRHMFDEGEVAWSDPPPFRAPVFVVTSRGRQPWVRQGGTTFTFVTGGVERAVALARDAAGDKDVLIAGGAAVVQQALNEGLVDEIQLHLAPVVLAAGVRLLERLDAALTSWEPTSAECSARVTHLGFRIKQSVDSGDRVVR